MLLDVYFSWMCEYGAVRFVIRVECFEGMST